MAQSFGFGRIAVSNLVAVFIAFMIAPVISFFKEHAIHCRKFYDGWNEGRLTQAEAAQILGQCEEGVEVFRNFYL